MVIRYNIGITSAMIKKIGKLQKILKQQNHPVQQEAQELRAYNLSNDSFMYKKAITNSYGRNVYITFGTLRISYKSVTLLSSLLERFSVGNSKSIGKIQIQILTPNGQWFYKYIIDKSTCYSSTSTEWDSVNVAFTKIDCGINFDYDQKDAFLADIYIYIYIYIYICFSKVMIKHWVLR